MIRDILSEEQQSRRSQMSVAQGVTRLRVSRGRRAGGSSAPAFIDRLQSFIARNAAGATSDTRLFQSKDEPEGERRGKLRVEGIIAWVEVGDSRFV